LLGTLPDLPRFLAASSWWKSRAVRWVFSLGGVVPIFRSRDGGTTANAQTFAACHEALSHGAHLAMFPEGEVHTGPSILPLKTGAARIVLGAAADAGVRGVEVVPVGIVYEARERFRSQCAIHIGEPILVDEWVERYRDDARRAVRELTFEMGERLRAVTVNHESWDDANLVETVATIASAAPETAPDRYARYNDLRRALSAAIARVGGWSGDRGQAIAAAVAAYNETLLELGLDHGDVAALPAPVRSRRRRIAAELAVLTPPAAVGVVTNAPAVALTGLAGRAVADRPTWRATVMGITGLFLFPLTWSGVAYRLRHRGWKAVTAVFVVAPLGGLSWIAWRGRWSEYRRLGRVERVEGGDSLHLRLVQEHREVVAGEVRALLVETEMVAGIDLTVVMPAQSASAPTT
jgi:glycerol-3-phosphate O-acyltransferase / dihydroxyacetone phosphate acyltransferase